MGCGLRNAITYTIDLDFVADCVDGGFAPDAYAQRLFLVIDAVHVHERSAVLGGLEGGQFRHNDRDRSKTCEVSMWVVCQL